MGTEAVIQLPEFVTLADRKRFEAKARQFLKAHENHITIHKLRLNQPLTPSDLSELERMMLHAGVGTPDDITRAKEKSNGLGVFIRSLIGLDREAAKQAFNQFLSGATATANQVEFVNMIVDYLTENGVMDPKVLYESPFTDKSPRGPEGVFSSTQVDQLVAVLSEIRERAAA
jgi:type I restriction enzyme R subunit